MFEVTAFVADILFVIGALYGGWFAIRRWKPPKWWLAVGYWFNAQAWGARVDGIPVIPSCWRRVLPETLCRWFASFFLITVTPPPDGESYEEARVHIDHQLNEIWKVVESWQRITARHERRFWHPRCCHNPMNRHRCVVAGCDEEVPPGMRDIGEHVAYYCPDHIPYQDQITDTDEG